MNIVEKNQELKSAVVPTFRNELVPSISGANLIINVLFEKKLYG